MKKILFASIIFLIGIFATPEATAMQLGTEQQSKEMGFRSDQILKSSDGFQLEIYTDHTWVLWENGVRHSLGIWKIRNGNLVLYYKDGSYLAAARLNLDRRGLISSIYIFSRNFKG